MKDICLVNYVSSAAVYGIGTYIKEYVCCLLKIGCRVVLIELGTDSRRSDVYIKEEGGIKTIHIPYIQNKNITAYNKCVCRLMRLYITDSSELVFHFHYLQSNSLLGFIKKSFPLSKSLLTVHYLYWSARLHGNLTIYEDIIKKNYKNIKKNYQDVIDHYREEKDFINGVDKVICLSDDTYYLLSGLYGIVGDKLIVIPNGLSQRGLGISMKQKNEKKNKIRQKYYIGNNEKLILFVGRIDPIKGIDPLLSCFNKVVEAYPNCRLLLIGDGDINGSIKKVPKTFTKITFAGRLDKRVLYQWYRAADLAVFPSFYEECSYVGIEMLMHGLPIVASDGYAVKNMFNESNAVIAPIECWSRSDKFGLNLANGILSLLKSDELLSLKGLQALQTYNEMYKLECMHKKYSVMLSLL